MDFPFTVSPIFYTPPTMKHIFPVSSTILI
jgi:hypothetical protein